MRQPWWEWGLWMYRSVTTQANGAGGAIVLDFVPLQGMTMMVLSVVGINSGTNTLRIQRVDEDNSIPTQWVSVASGAGTIASVPRASTVAGTGRIADSSYVPALLIRADDKLTVTQTGAGAQNDTLEVSIRALLSSNTLPIISKGRSTNQADVTIATPTVNMVR